MTQISTLLAALSLHGSGSHYKLEKVVGAATRLAAHAYDLPNVTAMYEVWRAWIRTPLLLVYNNLRNGHWGASCHSRLSINSRRFCKTRQSKFSSSATHNSLSSLAYYLSVCFYYISLIHGDLVYHYIWRSQRDNRKISSGIQFSEKRIESPSDTHGYRVLLIYCWEHWQVFGAIEKLGWDQLSTPTSPQE